MVDRLTTVAPTHSGVLRSISIRGVGSWRGVAVVLIAVMAFAPVMSATENVFKEAHLVLPSIKDMSLCGPLPGLEGLLAVVSGSVLSDVPQQPHSVKNHQQTRSHICKNSHPHRRVAENSQN